MLYRIARRLAEIALTCELVVPLRGRLSIWPVMPLPYFDRIVISSCPSLYNKIVAVVNARTVYLIFSRLSAHVLLRDIYILKCRLRRIIANFKLSERILRTIYNIMRPCPKRYVLDYLATSLNLPPTKLAMWWYRRRVIIELEPTSVNVLNSQRAVPGLLVYLTRDSKLRVARISACDLKFDLTRGLVVVEGVCLEGNHGKYPACIVFYMYDTYFRAVYQVVREGYLRRLGDCVLFEISRTVILRRMNVYDEIKLCKVGLENYKRGVRRVMEALSMLYGAGGGI